MRSSGTCVRIILDLVRSRTEASHVNIITVIVIRTVMNIDQPDREDSMLNCYCSRQCCCCLLLFVVVARILGKSQNLHWIMLALIMTHFHGLSSSLVSVSVPLLFVYQGLPGNVMICENLNSNVNESFLVRLISEVVVEKVAAFCEDRELQQLALESNLYRVAR